MLKSFVLLAAGVIAVAAIAWVTAPDPKFNPATFEDAAVEPRLAPLAEALTLAQFAAEGETATLLVTAYDGDGVTGLDLAAFGAPRTSDPFAALAAVARADLLAAAAGDALRITVAVEDLLPAGPPGERHIGVGTNFPEHAEEAASDSVFMFPKFGTPTPARTTIRAREDALLDYEVELCLRFDRPVASLTDFDAAVKGFFLCGDFTDRVKLLELADPDNLDSGYGFSDSKSGEGHYPTGPFIVIPNDWAAFADDLRMTTEVNGEPRQDARGAEMTKDFRELTEMALGEMSAPRFYYAGEFYELAPGDRIEADMTLMSGTSEGVIYTSPTRRDYIDMVLAYAKAGGPLSGRSLREIGVEKFAANERASGHFLEPGDVVTHRSSVLGEIEVTVVE